MVCDSRLKLSVACLFLVACMLDDPCPVGTRSGSRCMQEDGGELDPSDVDELDGAAEGDAPDESVSPEPGKDVNVVERSPDSSAEVDGSMATRLDADLMDVGPDGPSVEASLSDVSSDGSSDASDAVADAAPDADATTPPSCSDDARSIWRKFQTSEQIVPAIGACYAADPLCRTGQCNMGPCLQGRAEVVGCDACIAAEVACAALHCAVPCTIMTDDEACRACACAHRCLDAPAGCGMGSQDICADCSGASCSARRGLATQTITVPIFFHFLQDRTDPATGLPAYARSATENETILDIDARLAQINAVLESARIDDRRLQVIRAGVNYAAALTPGACPDPVVASDAQRLYGALNVVLSPESPGCAAAAPTAFAARASAATLLVTLGILLADAIVQHQGVSWQPTTDQLVRLHNYARWRLGAADSVPEAERQASTSFLHGPDAPIWDKLTNRDWALANASVFADTAPGPYTSHGIASFTVPAKSATRRVLGVRVSAKFRGTPSAALHVSATTTLGLKTEWPRSAIRVGDGELVAEEAYLQPELVAEDAYKPQSDGDWYGLRQSYAPGTYRVTLEDTAEVTFTDVRLELIVADRFFLHYDRHRSGIQDIWVYQKSSSELLTVPNPANDGTAFGASIRDRVPPLPKADAKLSAGDVDGDGTLDLLARDGPTIWVSYFKTDFGPWRQGSIAGSDRPSESDETMLGDLEGDGFGDLLRRRNDTANNRSLYSYYRGVGDGTFERARAVPVGPKEAGVTWTVADFYRTGRTDLVIPDHAVENRIWIHSNISHGTTVNFWGGFDPKVGKSRTILKTDRLLVLDANGDTWADLVTYRPSTREWGAYLNAKTPFTYGEWTPLTFDGSSTAFHPEMFVFSAMP